MLGQTCHKMPDGGEAHWFPAGQLTCACGKSSGKVIPFPPRKAEKEKPDAKA